MHFKIRVPMYFWLVFKNKSCIMLNIFFSLVIIDILVKVAVPNLFGLKMIQKQYLSKYITSQCSKLSPYFSPIHNG